MNKLPALEDMRVFATAARLMSFSKTAEQLLVSPAYISKRIKLLEENLGHRLFFRSARSISLTHEGKIVLIHTERLLGEIEDMQQALRSHRQEIKGELKISCSTGFGSTYINPYILDLRSHYPMLGINLNLTDLSVDLVSEDIDVDICIGGTIPEQYIARLIAHNQQILCASPEYLAHHGYPQHPHDLEKYHCITLRERNQSPVQWKLEQQGKILTISPNSRLSVNNGEVAKQWCLNGEGIILRSQWNVANELQQGKLIQILPQWAQTADVYAVYSRSIKTNASLRVFVENLEQYLTKNLYHD